MLFFFLFPRQTQGTAHKTRQSFSSCVPVRFCCSLLFLFVHNTQNRLNPPVKTHQQEGINSSLQRLERSTMELLAC